MTPFTLTSASHGPRRQLFLGGDVDILHADEFVELGRLLLGEPGVRTLAVDLSGVTFLDSTGIGGLIELRNCANEVGNELVLADPAGCVRDLLRMTALDTIFTIEDTAGRAEEIVLE